MAGRKKNQVQKQQQTAVVPVVSGEVIEHFKMIETECRELVAMDSQVEKFFKTGELVQKLQAAFDMPGVMDSFMQLQGSALGFKTDKDSSGGYRDLKVVRDALVSCFMYGIAPVGNQMNIISGQCYVAKEGFKYKLKHDKKCIDAGLDGFRLDNFRHVRNSQDTGTMVLSCEVHWGQSGEDYSHTLEEIHVIHVFPNGKYRGGSLDQACGKAERKAYAWLYNKITGERIPDGDASEAEMADAIVVEAETMADASTIEYLDSLLQNPAITQKARKMIADRWGSNDGITQSQAEQRIGSLLKRIKDAGGTVGTVDSAEAEEADPVAKEPEAKASPGDTASKLKIRKEIEEVGFRVYQDKWSKEKVTVIGLCSDATSLSGMSLGELEVMLQVLNDR